MDIACSEPVSAFAGAGMGGGDFYSLNFNGGKAFMGCFLFDISLSLSLSLSLAKSPFLCVAV